MIHEVKRIYLIARSINQITTRDTPDADTDLIGHEHSERFSNFVRVMIGDDGAALNEPCVNTYLSY
jgi:hypothetical protein